jgi:hypothetical protein
MHSIVFKVAASAQGEFAIGEPRLRYEEYD